MRRTALTAVAWLALAALAGCAAGVRDGERGETPVRLGERWARARGAGFHMAGKSVLGRDGTTRPDRCCSGATRV
jgi:hypothetical protein